MATGPKKMQKTKNAVLLYMIILHSFLIMQGTYSRATVQGRRSVSLARYPDISSAIESGNIPAENSEIIKV